MFERYLLSQGVCHTIMAPFYLASKGQAEWMVRSVKEALARMGQGDWYERVSENLLVQHITSHATTSHSPAKLLVGHCLESPLDQLHLDFALPEPSPIYLEPSFREMGSPPRTMLGMWCGFPQWSCTAPAPDCTR